jgi:peptidyl-tRNA hydrolase
MIDLTRTYIYIINEDLGMSKGKIAAQVSHVAMQLACYWGTLDREEGEMEPVIGKAIVLKAPESYLRNIIENTNKGKNLIVGQPVFYIEDAGLTQVPKGSLTCVGFVQFENIVELTKNLKLV